MTDRGRLGFFAAAALATCAWAVPGCSGGSGSGGGVVNLGITAAFHESGTRPVPNLVRLRSVSAVEDTITIEVAVSGRTTSSDLYAFAFDLVLSDPTVAKYVNGTALFGSALSLGQNQGQALYVSQSGGRIIVGISKTGGGPNSGNGIGDSEESVVRLTFQILKTGATTLTLAGSPQSPQNPTDDPAALDSAGTVIGSVAFDEVSATISGS